MNRRQSMALLTILSLGFGIDRIFYRELLFGEFFLCSLLLPLGYGAQRGCANQDAALIEINPGGQSFPCDPSPRESMDSKHVKSILGQVLVSVPYCTDWSFFFKFLRAAPWNQRRAEF